MKLNSLKIAQLACIPIFFEDFIPHQPSLFDMELNEITKTYALEKQAIHGFCNISATETNFTITQPSLRENVIALTSYSTARQRTMVCGVSVALFGHPFACLPEITDYINQKELKIYTAEANSPIFLALKEHVRSDLFYFSEYFGNQYSSGEFVGGIMHQDLQATSFQDNTFDLVLTSDVLEHVPDAIKAEKEIVRILKPGGAYCFTVPLLPFEPHDLILAELDAVGNIVYLAEPQYHGDPIRPEGILVFRLFSYNDLKMRFENLGCDINLYRFWSKTLGIMDTSSFVHVVRKNSLKASSVVATPEAAQNPNQPRAAIGRIEIESSLQLKLQESTFPASLKDVALAARLSEQASYIQTLNAEKTNLLVHIGQLQQWATTLEKQVLNSQANNLYNRFIARLHKLVRSGG